MTLPHSLPMQAAHYNSLPESTYCDRSETENQQFPLKNQFFRQVVGQAQE